MSTTQRVAVALLLLKAWRILQFPVVDVDVKLSGQASMPPRPQCSTELPVGSA